MDFSFLVTFLSSAKKECAWSSKHSYTTESVQYYSELLADGCILMSKGVTAQSAPNKTSNNG